MHRIIYLNDEHGYCVADVLKKDEIARKLATLAEYDVQIICVFDVESRVASFICKSFDLHIQLLKASYPSNFLGKIFRKLSLKKQPDYTMLTTLTRPPEEFSNSQSTKVHSA